MASSAEGALVVVSAEIGSVPAVGFEAVASDLSEGTVELGTGLPPGVTDGVPPVERGSVCRLKNLTNSASLRKSWIRSPKAATTLLNVGISVDQVYGKAGGADEEALVCLDDSGSGWGSNE